MSMACDYCGGDIRSDCHQAALLALAHCPIHGKPPVIYYPCCRGAAGGKASSPAKQASSRQNAAKARQATQTKRTLPGDALEPDRPP